MNVFPCRHTVTNGGEVYPQENHSLTLFRHVMDKVREIRPFITLIVATAG